MRIFILLAFLTIACTSCKSDKPLTPRINHVAMQVSNMKESVDFYTKAFDLKATNNIKELEITLADGSATKYDTHLVFLKFPGQDFVYELVENSKSDSLVHSPLFQHIGIDVLDIEESFKRATSLGAHVIVPIRYVRANDIYVKQAFINGPNNEVIELMQLISGEF